MEPKKVDGRRNNRGKIGNKGGAGRPATGIKPKHTVSATPEEWIVIQQFIAIVRTDITKAKTLLTQ